MPLSDTRLDFKVKNMPNFKDIQRTLLDQAEGPSNLALFTKQQKVILLLLGKISPELQIKISWSTQSEPKIHPFLLKMGKKTITVRKSEEPAGSGQGSI